MELILIIGNFGRRLLDELDLIKHTRLPVSDKTAQINTSAESNATKETKINEYARRTKGESQIADSHLECTKDKNSAFEIWKTLQNTFERKGVASQLLIRKTLLSMKFNLSKDVHFHKFDSLIRDFRSTGATLETNVACHLLLTLPSEYDTVVTAIETVHADNVTLSFVKNRLRDEELKKQSMKPSKGETQFSVVFAAGQGKSNKTVTNVNKNKLACHNCG